MVRLLLAAVSINGSSTKKAEVMSHAASVEANALHLATGMIIAYSICRVPAQFNPFKLRAAKTGLTILIILF